MVTLQDRCAELKLRAERKAGELLAAMPKNPGGRGKTSDTLSGVCDHAQSSRWQQVASVDHDTFEEWVTTVGLTARGRCKVAGTSGRPRPGPFAWAS